MHALKAISAALVVAVVGCAAPVETATQTGEAGVTRDAGPGGGGSLAAPVEAGVTLVIGAEQAGQTVSVAVGQRFAVALVGVPTAGYLWAPVTIPAFLTRAGEGGGPTQAAQNQPGFTGGNHWEVVYFAATGAGEGELVLAQRRPWETNEAPADSFRVTISAQ